MSGSYSPEKARVYRQRKCEHIRQVRAAYRARMHIKILAHDAQYRECNRDARRASDAEYRANNQKFCRQRTKSWKMRNREATIRQHRRFWQRVRNNIKAKGWCAFCGDNSHARPADYPQQCCSLVCAAALKFFKCKPDNPILRREQYICLRNLKTNLLTCRKSLHNP